MAEEAGIYSFTSVDVLEVQDLSPAVRDQSTSSMSAELVTLPPGDQVFRGGSAGVTQQPRSSRKSLDFILLFSALVHTYPVTELYQHRTKQRTSELDLGTVQ